MIKFRILLLPLGYITGRALTDLFYEQDSKTVIDELVVCIFWL